MGYQGGWPDLTSMTVYLILGALGMAAVAWGAAGWGRVHWKATARAMSGGFLLMAVFVAPYLKLATMNGWLLPALIVGTPVVWLMGKWGARGFP